MEQELVMGRGGCVPGRVGNGRSGDGRGRGSILGRGWCMLCWRRRRRMVWGQAGAWQTLTWTTREKPRCAEPCRMELRVVPTYSVSPRPSATVRTGPKSSGTCVGQRGEGWAAEGRTQGRWRGEVGQLPGVLPSLPMAFPISYLYLLQLAVV